ncbi:DUF6357 family protein [Cellulosimicrobium cellulans]|uniref:DUF6357 family protein n=1 Tax=Cellulosimicrobium cellulans TaxID=1710 RepID=UPI003663FDD7
MSSRTRRSTTTSFASSCVARSRRIGRVEAAGLPVEPRPREATSRACPDLVHGAVATVGFLVCSEVADRSRAS